jgi:hypothetical protein
VLNTAQGELSKLIQAAGSTSRIQLEQRFSTAEQDRFSSQEDRRLGVQSADGKAAAP